MKLLLSPILLLLTISSLGQQTFKHTSNKGNISDNSSFIDVKELNNNTQAIIIVECDAVARTVNPHPLGVWFDGAKWAVFNQDRAIMPEGIVFNITWKNTDANAYSQRSSANNISNGKMIVDNPVLNNNPAASFYASQIWNPGGGGGVYNNSDITTEYDKPLARWMIKNINGTAIPVGAAFNISIITPGKKIANINGTNTPVINNSNVFNSIDPGAIIPLNALSSANLNFENPLNGNWIAIGDAFTNQPIRSTTIKSERVLNKMKYSNGGIGGDYWKNLDYPIGVNGNAWIGTYENGNTDAVTGTLTSKSFAANARFVTFLLGGGNDINKLYVELQVKKSDYEAAWGAGKRGLFGDTEDGFTKVNRATSFLNTEDLFRYYFDLDAELNHQYAGKIIRIRLVDDKSSSWGHINVDDIRLDGDLAAYIKVFKDGYSLLADADKPIWGYFDSHAHPAADEAFGKKYYVGSCKTPLSTTWSNEVCTASHTVGRTLDGFTNTFDPHKFFDGGWPDMLGFPKFNGKMHQKYQVDLIKRAWQGGLKIFCALGVNNMYLATRGLGHNTNGEAIDDESVLFRQTAVIKEMANANSDWMEIAYTPADARRIILSEKLAIILGVENDVFGDFKSPDCNWSDRPEDRPLVTITEANADEKLENKLDEYYNLGLRQILPMHYLNQPFGGTAAFNGNTFLPQITFYDHIKVKSGVPDRIGFSLYEDFPTGAGFVGNGITYAGYAARIQKEDEGAETSMVSAEGLSPIGTLLFNKLMRKGFIIDQEHVSYQSKRDIFGIAAANNNYPVIASHCGPEGLSFIWTGLPVRFSNTPEIDYRNFGTTTIRFVSHEMELNDESYNGIRDTKGTIGVFLSLNHKRQYVGHWGNIENDCPGSTKTLAQMYCYSLDKMNGKGVGLASDFPMLDAICPRFGPYAAWALTVEGSDELKKRIRTVNRKAQTNGVRYDVASKSYYHEFFQGGNIDGFEEDVWKALAAYDAGANPFINENAVSLSGEPGHTDRIRSFTRGLFADNFNQLRTCCGDTPFEEAAMFLLKTNVEYNINELPAGFWRDHMNDVIRVSNNIQPAFITWKAKTGNNEPLRRCITGNRYWDFNLDGLAHYGLLPDMLQDLKNIGFSKLQLNPLFTSAEDYIQMWEKAELAKSNIHN